jgi:hypothetical protein
MAVFVGVNAKAFIPLSSGSPSAAAYLFGQSTLRLERRPDFV